MFLGIVRARPGVAIVLLLVFGSAWGVPSPGAYSGEPASTSILRPSNPDLAIETATVSLTGECRPSAPLFYISATIRNRGSGTAFADQWKSVVYARDTFTTDWGNGLRMPGIAGGDQQSVTIPIYFLSSSPNAMAGTHRFMVNVVAGDNVRESSYSNNQFGPLVVKVPTAICGNHESGQSSDNLPGALVRPLPR